MLNRIIQLDNSIIKNIKRLHSRGMNIFMSIITKLGSGAMIWFVLSAVMLIQIKTARTAVNIMFGLLITLIMGEGFIKHAVKRIRPSEILPEEEQIVDPPRYYSFPSGHTASSFSVVAVTILRCSPWVFIPVIILASTIGFSRIYLRVHYLSDVVGGVILGLSCGFLSVPLWSAIEKGLQSLVGALI